MPRISCKTTFDITYTGVTGFFRQDKIPFVDEAGTEITDKIVWTTSRNQNRNWETITQILSLRTQIFDVALPVKESDYWIFSFSVDSLSVYCETNQNELNVLKSDANNVPMLVLDNDGSVKVRMTDVYSEKSNLAFHVIQG